MTAKEKLISQMSTKIRTAFIGALAEFERVYGELPEWEEVRRNILKNGNNQIRCLEAELDGYEVEFKRYQYNFKIKDKG
jgi:hypothetical protein